MKLDTEAQFEVAKAAFRRQLIYARANRSDAASGRLAALARSSIATQELAKTLAQKNVASDELDQIVEDYLDLLEGDAPTTTADTRAAIEATRQMLFGDPEPDTLTDDT